MTAGKVAANAIGAAAIAAGAVVADKLSADFFSATEVVAAIANIAKLNVLNLTAGQIMLTGSDGRIYTLYIDGDGNVTTVERQIALVDLADDVGSGIDLSENVDVSDKVDQQTLSVYMRYNETTNKIEIGQASSPFRMELTPSRLSITQNGMEVAYFTSNKMYIVAAEFASLYKLGNCQWRAASDGGVLIK